MFVLYNVIQSAPVDWLKFNKNFNKNFQCENNKISSFSPSFLGSRPFFGSEEAGMDTIHELYVRLPKSIQHHLVLLTATTYHQVIATVVILFCWPPPHMPPSDSNYGHHVVDRHLSCHLVIATMVMLFLFVDHHLSCHPVIATMVMLFLFVDRHLSCHPVIATRS